MKFRHIVAILTLSFIITFAWFYFIPHGTYVLGGVAIIFTILAKKRNFLKSYLSHRDMQLALIAGILTGLSFLILHDFFSRGFAELTQLDRVTHAIGGYFISGMLSAFCILHGSGKYAKILLPFATIFAIATANEFADKLLGFGWDNKDFLAFFPGYLIQQLKLIMSS